MLAAELLGPAGHAEDGSSANLFGATATIEIGPSPGSDASAPHAVSGAAAMPVAATAEDPDAATKPAEDAPAEPSAAAAPQSAPAESSSEPPAETAEPAAPEPPPADPVVVAVRAKLADPAIRKDIAPADLAALESFYGGLEGPPLWVGDAGFSGKAKAAMQEIGKADDWGLSAAAFTLPPVSDQPASPEAAAGDEVALSAAILKYARYARGGRLTPSKVSPLFDQRPPLRDPKVVLKQIAAASAPDAYLRSLHPKHLQFQRLREALLQARARQAGEAEIARILINMERWRWMPPDLGSLYVWDNVPEFTARVVKGGKTIYTEKTIVGQVKYATPIFSSTMRSIVFQPDWTVPETILREDLQPALQRRGFFGTPDISILTQHGLKVSLKGQPVDASTVDWANVNIRSYTFTQPPGPDNVLGRFKFNFPNRHAVYMHDTVQPELFAETQRTLSHGCIRVRQPDRLAALLLGEDKKWTPEQVEAKLANSSNTIVPLNRPIPVHITYFTLVADEQGNLQSFVDVYGLDGRTAQALLGTPMRFPGAPSMVPGDMSTPEPAASRKKRAPSGRSPTGGFGTISGLFGN
jgi:murein L,D-transpeptidase YcbB/YkuD